VVGPAHVHGLLQRVGLTTGDAWIIASAIWMMRDNQTTSRPTASGKVTYPAG